MENGELRTNSNLELYFKRFFLEGIISLFLLFNVVSIHAFPTVSSEAEYVQKTKLSLNLKNVSLEDFFNDIKAQSEYSFVINRNNLDLSEKISVKVNAETVIAILDEVLPSHGIAYEISEKHIFIFKKAIPAQEVLKKEAVVQKRKITGVVLDRQDEPVIGATVFIRGTKTGTVTNIDGRFVLDNVALEKLELEVSSIGFKKIIYTVLPNVSTVVIHIEEDVQALGEVVIVGYGMQKKQTVTGAISAIQTKELVQSPQANVSNMLVGRMSGLLAVQRSGEPGNDQSTLRIRGVGTFGSGQDPLVMVDGIETANYNNIDPNEIESLSVLKDASATAVYGVRGANGVIIITTKRGVDGKPHISYSGNFAANRFTDLRESMGAYDFTTYSNEAYKYDAFVSGSKYVRKYLEQDIAKYHSGEDPIFYPDINWYDLMLKPVSFTTQHNVSVSGGAKNVKYFISAGYFHQNGQFKESELNGYDVQSYYERFNLRANLDFQITKRLTAKLNFASQMETINGNNANTTKIMGDMAKADPISTPGIINGKVVDLSTTTVASHPLKAMYMNGAKKDYRNNLNGSLRFDYSFDPWVKGLGIHTLISYEDYYKNERTYSKEFVYYKIFRLEDDELAFKPSTKEGPFSLNQSWSRNRRTYFEAGLDYNRTFGNHAVTALMLYNQSKRYSPDLAYKIPNGYQGLVGRATYAYKSKYLVEFNVGYNGTENFAEGKRFGVFPAYSLGWVVSEEDFFPKNKVVTFLKFRGSYGEVGNDRIGGDRFLYLPTVYQYDNNGYYFGEVGSSYVQYQISKEGKLGNPDLTWEKAKKTDIGAEVSFWDNKIKVTLDYFMEKRNNILSNKGTVPTIVGANLPAYNLGRMKNSGWDGDITFRNSFRDINYWMRANFTYAHNIIEYMDEVSYADAYRNQTGQRYGQHFGLICDGIYNSWEEVNSSNRPMSSWNNNKLQPGDLIYRDINGDGIIDNGDLIPIRYSNFPEIAYGFSLGGDWKGFDFSVLFQGATHVSYQASRLYMFGVGENFSIPTYLKDSWSYDRYSQGLPINFPHLSVGNTTQQHNYQASTFWTRDASYLRLKNIEIGYSVNPQKLKGSGISSLRLFVNASNLFTWDNMLPGLDPEVPQLDGNSAAYPLTQIYNVGVNIGF